MIERRPNTIERAAFPHMISSIEPPQLGHEMAAEMPSSDSEEAGRFDRRGYLLIAVVFEAALVVLAFGIGWFVDVDPLEHLTWSNEALIWGILGTVPPLMFFAWSYRTPFGPFERIQHILIDHLGPFLAACRWYELIVLAAIVGFCEETLFRGLLQPWFSQWGLVAGLVGSNILFGLAHAVTLAYGLLAGGIGIYLGLMSINVAEGSLLAPIVTHGLYDLIAFWVVARTYRKQIADTELISSTHDLDDGDASDREAACP